VLTAPRVVTSVRRVGARRAAGPPKLVVPAEAGAAAGDPGAAVDDAGQDGAGVDEAGESSQPHVPVKKKGSRKR
jgi:ribonuclease E